MERRREGRGKEGSKEGRKERFGVVSSINELC